MPITGSTKKPPAGDIFTRATNPDVMTVPAELLSNQHMCFRRGIKVLEKCLGGSPETHAGHNSRHLYISATVEPRRGPEKDSDGTSAHH